MTAQKLISAIAVQDQYLPNLSVYTIRHLARIGTLPAVKVGHRTWFRPADIEAWMAKLPKASR